MKIISARQEKIARVNCSCCGEDDHFVDIFFNKHLDLKDPEEYLFEFIFDTKDDIYVFPSLKQRINDVKSLVKNEDNFRHDETVDAILLDLEQVSEIYDVVLESTKKVLSEGDLIKIDSPEKPKFIKKYIKLKGEQKSNWLDVYFFRSEDSLTMLMDVTEDEKNPNKVFIHDFEIGWFIPQNTELKYIRMYAWNWLLKRSKSGMRHMSCSLIKSEAIQFLASLNYILANIEEEDEVSFITI